MLLSPRSAPIFIPLPTHTTPIPILTPNHLVQPNPAPCCCVPTRNRLVACATYVCFSSTPPCPQAPNHLHPSIINSLIWGIFPQTSLNIKQNKHPRRVYITALVTKPKIKSIRWPLHKCIVSCVWAQLDYVLDRHCFLFIMFISWSCSVSHAYSSPSASQNNAGKPDIV